MIALPALRTRKVVAQRGAGELDDGGREGRW